MNALNNLRIDHTIDKQITNVHLLNNINDSGSFTRASDPTRIYTIYMGNVHRMFS